MKQTDERIRIRQVKSGGRTYQRFEIDLGRDDNGRRRRRSLGTYEEAAQELDRQAKLKNRIGRKARRLTDDQLSDAARALDVLAGNASLATAADFWMTHNRPTGVKQTTCGELLDMYIDRACKAERRDATIKDIGHYLKQFRADFGTVPAAHVATAMLKDWQSKQTGAPRTRNKRRVHLVGMFNFAIKRSICEANPAAKMEIATVKRPLPYVMPVADVEKVLTCAVGNQPEMVPYYALAIFAGIRSAEIQRLDWKAIDFGRKEIFITSEVSKTHDERFVPMADNLGAWLAPYRQASGSVFYSRRLFRRMLKETAITYEADCFRHSFGSYHLAHGKSTLATAEAMGQRSVGMIFRHYRRAVRDKDAKAFWQLMTKTKGSVIAITA